MFGISINWKSVGKAAKAVGVAAVGVAVPAVIGFAENPEVFAPLVLTLGPLGILAAPAIAFGVAYAKDAWKHRTKPPVEGDESE